MKYLLNRALQMVLILFILSAVLFGLLSAMPGNPVDMLITSNPRIKPEDIVRLKKLRGLDKPWYVQYVRWIWGYYDPIRPVKIADFEPQEEILVAESVRVKVNVKDMLIVSNIDTNMSTVERVAKNANFAKWEKLKQNPEVIEAIESNKSENLWVYLNEADPDFVKVLKQELRNNYLASLQIEGMWGSKVNNFEISKEFNAPGEYDLWFSIKNSYGLTSVGQIPVVIKPKAGKMPQFLGAPQITPQIVDDPQKFKVDLGAHIKAENPHITESLRYEIISGPGKIDANGVYTNTFKDPGQSAILYTAYVDSLRKIDGAFTVEYGPIANKNKFNRGFLFAFTGDKEALGFSTAYKRPVWSLLKGRVANTVQLMLPAILISLILALPIGILSAYRQYSVIDYTVNFFAFVGISLPVFWFAIMVMFVFAENLNWFPAGGIQTPGFQGSFWQHLMDRLQYAVLPTIVLSIAYIGTWLRYMRASMLEVLPSDYIRTARAKGLSETKVIMKHALRNALIPVVTIIALSVPVLFGGAVLTETVFAWPGIGRLQYDAVMNSDYYVAIVVFLISSALVMLGNLLADVLYVLVDPRIRNS